MPFYLKKPIPIEAREMTPESINELVEWSNASIVKHVDGTPRGMMVWTLEGTMTGRMGDYLCKGVRGEFYFCAREIFHETYTLVSEK